MNRESNKKGFSLIGAVAGVVVASIILLAFTTLISKAVVVNSVNGQRLQAILYLQETIEVAKDLEQSGVGWSKLVECEDAIKAGKLLAEPEDRACYPINITSWTLGWNKKENLKNNLDIIYTRWLTIEDVYRRDLDNEIATLPCTEPCTLDPNTKKIIAEIEWNDQLRRNPLEPNHLKLEAYLYNI